MYISLVRGYVKPARVADFIELIRANHLGSVAEPGCLRFDVAQSRDDDTRFVLWECYVDEAAAREHKTTEHYLAFKAGSVDMMAEDRINEPYTGLFPEAPATD
jgi:autoinducer 2-degrading protein